MTATRNPKSMTAGERRDEIAAILAGGLLRAFRDDRRAVVPADAEVEESGPIRLDLSANSPLSVAPRPAGSGRVSESRVLEDTMPGNIATEIDALHQMTTNELTERYEERKRTAKRVKIPALQALVIGDDAELQKKEPTDGHAPIPFRTPRTR